MIGSEDFLLRKRHSRGKYPWMTMPSKTVAYKKPAPCQTVCERLPSNRRLRAFLLDNKIVGQTSGGNPRGAVKDFNNLKVWQ